MQFVCVWFDLHSDMPFGCTLFGCIFPTFSCTKNCKEILPNTNYTHIYFGFGSAVSKVNTETKFLRFVCAKNLFWDQMVSIAEPFDRQMNEKKRKRNVIQVAHVQRHTATNDHYIHTHIMMIIRTRIERATAFVMQKKVKSRCESTIFCCFASSRILFFLFGVLSQKETFALYWSWSEQ